MDEKLLDSYLERSQKREVVTKNLDDLIKLEGTINDVDYYVEVKKKYYPEKSDDNIKYYVLLQK